MKRRRYTEATIARIPEPTTRGTRLADLEVGASGIVSEFYVPEYVAEQLMNLGFVPGLEVTAAQSGPGGDPRVYRVDGTEVALRRGLARQITVKPSAVGHVASQATVAASALPEPTLSLGETDRAPSGVAVPECLEPTLSLRDSGLAPSEFAPADFGSENVESAPGLDLSGAQEASAD